MKFASSWRLSLALAAIALLAAFATWPGGAPRSAEADVTSVTPTSTYGDDGSNINISIAGGTAGGDTSLTITATGTSTIAAVACDDTADADCGAFTAGNPANWAAVDGPYTATVRLTLDCSDVEAITITVTHDGDSTPVRTVYCVPELSDPQVEIEKQSNDNGNYDFDWDANGGDCLVIADDGTVDLGGGGNFDLEDNDNARFYCENSVSLQVDEIDDGDFVRIEDCDEGDDGIDDIAGSRVEFDVSELGTGDTVFCTWVNDEDFQIPATPGPVKTVSIVLSATKIDCGGSTLVQVVPRNSVGGPAPAGTVISVTSSLGGVFEPTNSLTSAFPIGLANFLYTAPDNASGITTITARAGNVQTSAAVQIVCEVAAATATPAPLSPPSAGGGGLLDSSGSNYLPTALAIAAAAVALGLTAATRRFAMAPDSVTQSFAEPVTDLQQPRSFALLLSLAMLVVALMSRRWR
jgi:hypothetical protein